MRHRRKSVLLIALLMAFALFGAACAGGGGGETGDDGQTGGEQEEAVQGGTVTFGAEQEPSESLNGILAVGNLFWEAVINNQVLEGAYEVQPDFSYEPELIEDDPELTEDPFSLTYTIRDEAEWSDGEPIDAGDMNFTVETYMNKKNAVVSRAGYDKITDVEMPDGPEGKTIKFTFSEPYAGWRDLFYRILPEHALQGEDFNKVWNKGIIDPKTGEGIANGPFMYEGKDSYKPGQSLTLVANENYWKGRPNLDEIVFRFGLEETTSEIQALKGEEVQAIYPQPQLELIPLLENPDFQIETNAGTTWEHIDFQFGNPLLKQQFVREAIAAGIDRDAIVERLFSQLEPELQPLNNMIFLSNSPFYEEHFQDVDADPARATQLLEDNGCTKGDDGIYECDGERMSFGFMSTAGNRLREIAFEIIQEQLRGVGIELKSEFGDPAVVFGAKGLVGGNYDLFMFAWVGSPDPAGSVEIHKCEGAQNYQGYCNEEVTKLLEKSDTIVDPEERADVMNQADALMAEDVPILPLYQKPTFFASSVSLQNAEDNPTSEGPTWNSEDWFLSDGGQ